MLQQEKSGANPSEARLDQALAALAHPVRRAILDRLLESELSIGELSAPFGLKKPTISRHIRVLEEARLIERTVAGRVHRCRINPVGVRELRRWLDRYQRFWTDQLDELDRYLADEGAAG
jgi:DNA-binding transcriptional ArsR family regulator